MDGNLQVTDADYLSPSFIYSNNFDYSSFMQPLEQPADLFSHGYFDSSAGSLSAGSRGQASSPSPVSSDTIARQTSKRLERRGHTKSRRGCYNCKRRRIKCQETRPACGHCVKTGLKCEYPSLPTITHQPHHQIPLFSLQDMRMFQHFLTQCYPHHPLKQEEIWTHEIPSIAHNHDFLMHAILGFAASELEPIDSSMAVAAMNHRVRAIKAIKKRLMEDSHRSASFEECNAMVATCYALTFQSVSMEDGLAEYMTFIRGIVIVGFQMMFKGMKPLFSNMVGQEQHAVMEPLMESLPLIEKGWADAAKESIERLRPLCATPVETQYQEALMAIVEQLYISSFEAYRANSKQYGWWMLLPHSMFQELINFSNQTIVLLHAHWIALSQIMAFITQQEYEARDKHPRCTQEQDSVDPGFIRWLKNLNSRVDYEHQAYNQWPMWVDQQLDADISFFGKTR
ncbi:hypothetical protein B0I35DRAFT_477623 [Stachybotrys elegans]|uniref:Zn(2)-C6 fungal-type domain-containing protein n=1 Tax=Stachybotrys elegans TaxID=80388 RepID=A0A8K0SVU7_9HYPO|nr:hypothetical protein B0I35DRAFT_477623 [Stachybotrys elegans]